MPVTIHFRNDNQKRLITSFFFLSLSLLIFYILQPSGIAFYTVLAAVILSALALIYSIIHCLWTELDYRKIEKTKRKVQGIPSEISWKEIEDKDENGNALFQAFIPYSGHYIPLPTVVNDSGSMEFQCVLYDSGKFLVIHLLGEDGLEMEFMVEKLK